MWLLAPPALVALVKHITIIKFLIVIYCLYMELYSVFSGWFLSRFLSKCLKVKHQTSVFSPSETGGECFVWGEEADRPGPFTRRPPYMSASTSTRDCHKEPQRYLWVAAISHQIKCMFLLFFCLLHDCCPCLSSLSQQPGPCPQSCPCRRRTGCCRESWRGWRTCWHTAEPTETSSPSSMVQ